MAQTWGKCNSPSRKVQSRYSHWQAALLQWMSQAFDSCVMTYRLENTVSWISMRTCLKPEERKEHGKRCTGGFPGPGLEEAPITSACILWARTQSWLHICATESRNVVWLHAQEEEEMMNSYPLFYREIMLNIQWMCQRSLQWEGEGSDVFQMMEFEKATRKRWILRPSKISQIATYRGKQADIQAWEKSFLLKKAKTKGKIFRWDDGLGRDSGILDMLCLSCLLWTLPGLRCTHWSLRRHALCVEPCSRLTEEKTSREHTGDLPKDTRIRVTGESRPKLSTTKSRDIYQSSCSYSAESHWEPYFQYR